MQLIQESSSVRNLIYAISMFISFAVASVDIFAQDYTLVINNGRVIDPETGLDDIRHLGIKNGEITSVSATPLDADNLIDARGLVVAPGFIDLHTHTSTPLGQYYQLFDGVTTALELEAGAYPVASYGGEISDTPLINFGASAGYAGIRVFKKDGLRGIQSGGLPEVSGLKGWGTLLRVLFLGQREALSRSFMEAASAQELVELEVMLNQSLDNGALGIGMALDYISEAVKLEELRMVFQVAGQRRLPVFVHIRRGINGDPSGLREVLALARETGAPLHICHITHNAMKNIELFLTEIQHAQASGVDVTTELLPFNAGSAFISAAVFHRDWQTIFDIDYSDVQWAETGEWLTEERFKHFQETEPNGPVIHHYLKEAWTQRALIEPGVMIVSDALAMNSKEAKVPPHNGAFTKILGRYVREEQIIDLPTAIAKMSLLPAKRLEGFAPAFKRKGRIQPQMDADLVIFDPNTVINQATYLNPYQEAKGISHVIVNGVHLVKDGELQPETYPGQRLMANTVQSQRYE